MKHRYSLLWIIPILTVITSCQSPFVTQLAPRVSQPYPKEVQETENLVSGEPELTPSPLPIETALETENLVTEEPELTPSLLPIEAAQETEDLVTEEPEPTPTLPFIEPSNEPQITPSPPSTDPHIEINLDQTLYKRGDLITITGIPVDIGQPDYSLVIRDEGVEDAEPIVWVTYQNQQTKLSGKSQILELISVEASAEQVTFILRANQAGTTTVTILATGEVNTGYPGPAIPAEGAGEIVIVVEG
jgi:hypothetical protein